MADPMFDTHRYYQTLKEGGFSEGQAETMTAAFSGTLSSWVATKADIAELRGELRAQIATLHAELTLKIDGTSQRLLFQLTAIMTALLALFEFAGHYFR